MKVIDERATAPTDVIPLREAVLCVDCENLTRAKNGHCIYCGGHAVLNVAKILDREEIC